MKYHFGFNLLGLNCEIKFSLLEGLDEVAGQNFVKNVFPLAKEIILIGREEGICNFDFFIKREE